MYLERVLQINIATMAALGTLLLGMGQQNDWLPLSMFLAAFTSVWLTDITGWFRLNRTVTNLAAVVALFIFLRQLSEFRGMEQILAIGNFLAYLQIILLFQKKDPRTYGCLALLSLVQVVVAAALDQQIWFGLLLVVYLFVGLSALPLLFLHGERSRYRAAAGRLPAPVAEDRRWPLAGQRPTFTDSTSGARGQAGVGRELRRRVIRMGVGTVALTVVLFFTLPRWGYHPWRGAAGARRPVSGFLDTVRLNEPAGSSILEDPAEVLRIRLFDDASGRPCRVSGPLYLRGVVLTDYRQGNWKCQRPSLGGKPRRLEVTRPESADGLVRQRIEIEPMERVELFCVWPFFNTRRRQALLFDPARQSLLRPPSERNRRFAYELTTTAFHYGFQASLVPVSARRRVVAKALRQAPPTEGDGAMPELVALAEQWVREAGLGEDDPFACARLLEQQLRDSGRFQYSLAGQPRDPSIDPIEDFVTRNPRGHCEYFATALALMLRSRGIPARLVVGYKTEEWNQPGRFFQVRQLHAHTWVEAYLEPRQIPAQLAFEESRRTPISGAWLRLDPTPAAPAPSGNGLLDAVGNAFDWLDLAWANYVVEMDRSRQQEAVYDPLAETLAEAGRRLTDSDWWRTSFGRLGATLRSGLGNSPGERWFSWRGGLLAMGVALVLILAFQGLRVGSRKLLLRFTARVDAAGRRARTRVEFYRRLETLLARLGLIRAAWQTQREFAREAGVKIAASTGQAHLADLPILVAEAFYRVRFGGMPLDSPQTEAVEQALNQLKQAVGGGRHTATAASAS